MSKVANAIVAALIVVAAAAVADEPVTILAPKGYDIDRFGDLAVSPDGAWVAFVVNGSKGSRLAIGSTVDTTNIRVFDDTAGARSPFWSPEGKTIGYFTDRELRNVAADGGRSAAISACRDCYGGTWGTRGVLYYTTASRQLQWLQTGARNAKSIGEIDHSRHEYAHVSPRFLPDGERFLFVAQATGVEATSDLYLSDFLGRRQLLAHKVGRAAMLDAGTAIYNRDSKIIALDIATGKESELFGGAETSLFDSNGRGAVAHIGYQRPMTVLAWYDRLGSKLSVVTPPGMYQRPRISPDGKLLAYQDWGSVVVRKVEGPIVISLRSGFLGVAFSPDSQRIVAPLIVNGKCVTAIATLEGGAVQPLCECAQVYDWSPDGRQIAVETRGGATSQTYFRLVSLDGSYVDRQFLPHANQGWFRFSPDGKSAAFDATPVDSNGLWRAEDYGVYQVALDRPSFPKLVSASGGYRPAWSAIGTQLFYVDQQHRIVRSNFKGDAISRSNTWFVEFDVAPDGEKLIVNERVDSIEFLRSVSVPR